MTSSDIVKALRVRYPSTAYALLEQVGNGTGASCNRWADVLVMSLWPSRGLNITGIEIKVSRSDWISELNDPAKADAVAKYCDFWCLAIPKGPKIVLSGELPPPWGLIEIDDTGKAKHVKDGERLTPTALDRTFVAAVMRRAQDQVTPEAEFKRVRDEGRKAGIAEERDRLDYERQQMQKEIDDCRAFEKASGVILRNTWNHGAIGEAVKSVLRGEHRHQKELLKGLLKSAETIRENIAATLVKLDAPPPASSTDHQ